eukprot:876917-Alexandrium_andersonii.AAC.1
MASTKNKWAFLQPEGEDAKPAPKPDMSFQDVAKELKMSGRKTKNMFKAKVMELTIQEVKPLFAPISGVLLRKYRDMDKAIEAEGNFR